LPSGEARAVEVFGRLLEARADGFQFLRDALVGGRVGAGRGVGEPVEYRRHGLSRIATRRFFALGAAGVRRDGVGVAPALGRKTLRSASLGAISAAAARRAPREFGVDVAGAGR
jgi:hypothetical protein